MEFEKFYAEKISKLKSRSDTKNDFRANFSPKQSSKGGINTVSNTPKNTPFEENGIKNNANPIKKTNVTNSSNSELVNTKDNKLTEIINDNAGDDVTFDTPNNKQGKGMTNEESRMEYAIKDCNQKLFYATKALNALEDNNKMLQDKIEMLTEQLNGYKIKSKGKEKA